MSTLLTVDFELSKVFTTMFLGRFFVTWTFIKLPGKLKFETAAVAVCKKILFELLDKFVAEAVLRLSLGYVQIAILQFPLHLLQE